MTRNYLAFDIEIVKSIPPDVKDWREVRPLGISCAAVLGSDDPRPTFFCRGMYGPAPLPGPMTIEELSDLVGYLKNAQDDEYTILTWNGLGFDFNVLAEESGMHAVCAELARNHVDMMYHVYRKKGYPLGLDKVAQGVGVEGKQELTFDEMKVLAAKSPPLAERFAVNTKMSGDLAPILWGLDEEARRMVLNYVGEDVKTTLAVAEAVDRLHALTWTSRSGKGMWFPIREWLTVEKAMSLPDANQSWMTDPIPNESFVGWLKVAETHTLTDQK